MIRRAVVVRVARCALRRALRARGPGLLGLATSLALAAPAAAQPSFLVPIASEAPLALGAAWDREDGRPIGEPGSCMDGTGVDRHEGGPTTWTLVVLSRAGGRLLVGVHVARTVASEGIAEARVPDAARRLAQRGGNEEFRSLCGDGFVAARALGDQYVGEIEIGPGEAPVASARLRTGVWTERASFEAALAALAGVRGAQARELPEGRRADGVSLPVDTFVERAVSFADGVTAENARPYLAMVRAYPASSFAGTVVAIDPTLGWGDAARAVFLHDAGAGMGGSAAALRSAEMRKAVVQRRPGDPRRPADPEAGAAPVAIPAPAAAMPDAPPAAAPVASTAPAAPAASAPFAPAPMAAIPAAIAAPAPAPPAAVARRQRVAALVYAADAGETPVLATTEPPPGVYAERVKQRVYWIPGVAAATPAVREALARAAAGPPVRGTTIVVATVGEVTVVLTDVAPAPGVHAEPAGGLRAWIAGVGEPTPAQREALAAAARGGD